MLTRRTPRSISLPARHGFTLIELLVVISIIAILIALTATAAFGVRRNMQKQNCEVTLEKIDVKVQQKVTDIRDRIQDDIKKGNAPAEYNAALGLTNNNPEGAKAIMLYARLKQQLPMSFAEARTAFVVNGFTYQQSPAFNSLPATGSNTLEESAACLYAAIAPMGLEGLEQQAGTNKAQQKVFVDGFGTPIAFIRVAFDGNLNELNVSPQAKNPASDPFDPDNKATAALNNAALWTTFLGPQLSDAGAYSYPTTYRATGTNRNHAIALLSAGTNRQWIDSPATGVFDGDNLFSYRLRREGKHGD